MWAAAIVEIEIPPERGARIRHAVVGAQVHLLIFHRAPKPLDEHVVPPRAFAVHADLDLVRRQHAGESRARELRALIGVEDVWLAMLGQCLCQRLDAEGSLQGDRHPPREDPPREPVEHDREIDEALGHGHVGDVHGPNLVRRRDRQSAQQIRIDLVARLGLGRARPPVQGLYPRPPHEGLHMPAADLAPIECQQAAQHPRTGEWELGVQPVDLRHEVKVGRRYRARQVVNRAACNADGVSLPGNAQLVITVDHRFAFSNPALLSAPSKKSFSSVSSPILACRTLISTAGAVDVEPPPGPKTLAAPASNWSFQVVIWLAWTPYCSES